MSYTIAVQYELTERPTDDQLARIREVLSQVVQSRHPLTPGYDGQIIKATVRRYICDSHDCRECQLCFVPDELG
jgi:hypothetical protein